MKIVSKHPLFVGTAVLTLVTGGLYGCKNFLTDAAKPQGTLDQTQLFNATGVEGALIAAYRALDCNDATNSDWGCAASNWVWGNVAADDAFKGSTSDDQPPINDIELYTWGTPNASTYLNTKWKNLYEGINRANYTLQLLKQVQAANPGTFSKATADAITGEAVFLRAHYHFEAWRMWGNIPYYRETDTDFRKANMKATDVPAEINKDLDQAIALLPTKPRNGEKGRATQWTAKAYKGRVLVYSGQWAAAITQLEEVRAAKVYGLMPSFDQVWSGIGANRNGPEEILAFQASVNDGDPNGNNGNYGERLNFPYSGSHFGCCGFNQPTFNLVNFFRVDANGLPLAITGSPGNSPYSTGGSWNTDNVDLTGNRNTIAVDPRLDWTVGRDSVPYKDWGLYSLKNGWVRDSTNGGPYSPKKNAQEKASNAESSSAGWEPPQENSVHIHLFRYADLALLLAEAYVEQGQLGPAVAIVDSIRARAGAKVQGCGSISVGAKFPGCTTDSRMAVAITDYHPWANYKIGLYGSFPSQAYAREAVRAERRLELAMEGQRFFDLRRWGLTYAAAAINGFINGEGGGSEKSRIGFLASASPFVSKHMLYPIPSLEIDLSAKNGTPTLTQNTGW